MVDPRSVLKEKKKEKQNKKKLRQRVGPGGNTYKAARNRPGSRK